MSDISRNGGPIGVLVAERDAITRLALAALLESADGIWVCGQAATAEQACRLARETAPDVAVIDFRLGGSRAIDVSREIRSYGAQTRVVILTGGSERDAACAAILAGASSWLTKQARGGELIATVRAAAGQRSADLDLTGVWSRLAVVRRAGSPSGVDDGEIAAALHLDQRDVRTRVKRMIPERWADGFGLPDSASALG